MAKKQDNKPTLAAPPVIPFGVLLCGGNDMNTTFQSIVVSGRSAPTGETGVFIQLARADDDTPELYAVIRPDVARKIAEHILVAVRTLEGLKELPAQTVPEVLHA